MQDIIKRLPDYIDGLSYRQLLHYGTLVVTGISNFLYCLIRNINANLQNPR